MNRELTQNWNNALAKAKMICQVVDVHPENCLAILSLKDNNGNQSGLLTIDEGESKVELKKFPYEILEYRDKDLNQCKTDPFILACSTAIGLGNQGILDTHGKLLLSTSYYSIGKVTPDICFGYKTNITRSPMQIVRRGIMLIEIEYPYVLFNPENPELKVILDYEPWGRRQRTLLDEDNHTLTILAAYRDKVITRNYQNIYQVHYTKPVLEKEGRSGEFTIVKQGLIKRPKENISMALLSQMFEHPEIAERRGFNFI